MSTISCSETCLDDSTHEQSYYMKVVISNSRGGLWANKKVGQNASNDKMFYYFLMHLSGPES